MNVRSTVQPGQRGAKKLFTQYGDRLVCVRYRYDDTRQRRFKTVELIVEEEAWSVPKPSLKNEDLVHLAIASSEGALRRQVKQRGGRWNPQQRLWEIRYEQVVALRLQDRMIDTKGL